MAGVCFNCLRLTGLRNRMVATDDGYVCEVCKAYHARHTKRSAITSGVFMGGFALLLMASVLFDAYPQLESSLTWTALYSLYLIYFGLAFANFRVKVYG